MLFFHVLCQLLKVFYPWFEIVGTDFICLLSMTLRCPHRDSAPYYWPHHGFACFVLLDCFLLPTFEKLIFWAFGRICETKVHFMDYPLLFCFVMLFCHIVLKSRTAFFLRFLGSVLSSYFYWEILFLHLCVLILLNYNFSSSSFSSLSGLVLEEPWYVCVGSLGCS